MDKACRAKVNDCLLRCYDGAEHTLEAQFTIHKHHSHKFQCDRFTYYAYPVLGAAVGYSGNVLARHLGDPGSMPPTAW